MGAGDISRGLQATNRPQRTVRMYLVKFIIGEHIGRQEIMAAQSHLYQDRCYFQHTLC